MNIHKIKKYFLLTFLTILSFLAFSNTFAYSQVDTIRSAISKEHNLIKYFAEKAGVKTPIDYAPINEYMQIIAHFETRIQNDRKNSCYRGGVNTAKGYFQFLDGTFWWIYDTIRGTKDRGEDDIEGIDPDFPEGRYIYEYSYAGQAQFSITLWYKMAGPEKIKKLFERDYDTGLEIYCKYHHTDCDAQLTPDRYKELKDALHNWSIDLYHMTPEKRARLEKERKEKLEKKKKELRKAIKIIEKKIKELIEKKKKEKSTKIEKKEKSKKIEDKKNTKKSSEKKKDKEEEKNTQES